MKLHKLSFCHIIIFLFCFSFYACHDKDNDDSITPSEEKGKYADFDFKTVKEYTVYISITDQKNEAFKGVYLEVFSENPLNEAGVILPSSIKTRLFKGISNNNGDVDFKINPPTSVENIYVLCYQVGLPQLTKVTLNSTIIKVNIGNDTPINSALKSVNVLSEIPNVASVNNYFVLGSWQSNGKPNYLESENDQLDYEFLQDINASLPEGRPLTQTHPQYLTNSDDANIILIDDAEVWVTFVHEGAGWKNALGYYTYPNGNPPSSTSDIEDLTIIYPNVSYEQGTLRSGNKVQLLYLDKEKNEYTSIFPANKTVGWFIIANGWNSSTRSVTNGSYTHYSNSNLNIENSEALRKHNVLLYDEKRELFVLGFEDIDRRASFCDNDFNDAIFYTTVSPFTAVKTDNYQPIDTPDDKDNDGVSDNFDDYPEDPTKAFNNYYIAENQFGTLAFEDLWPGKGDYDFNDLVVAYNFNQITNASNYVVELHSQFQVKAIGASYKNAFGFSLNIEPSLVKSITGQIITENNLSIASNGTENGQSKATIICFDNPYNLLKYSGNGIGVNTDPSMSYVEPKTIDLLIQLTRPISLDNFGTPPYNPFIIVNQNRDKEIHLPNHPPTDLANTSYFGTLYDDSETSSRKYYVSDQLLPWAINIPIEFKYPIEKMSILDAYKHFDTWAISKGSQYKDWYIDKTDYRNSNNIYSK